MRRRGRREARETIVMTSLGGFSLVAILVLLTLRRHRTAIERLWWRKPGRRSATAN